MLIIRSCQLYPASFILKTFNVGSNEDQFVEIKLKKSAPATEILTFFTRVKINAIMFWKQRRPSFSKFVSFFIQLWLSFGEWKWRHPWKKQHITWRSLGNPCWRSHNVLVVRKTFGDHFVTKNHSPIKKYFCLSLHQLAFEINIYVLDHKIPSY